MKACEAEPLDIGSRALPGNQLNGQRSTVNGQPSTVNSSLLNRLERIHFPSKSVDKHLQNSALADIDIRTYRHSRLQVNRHFIWLALVQKKLLILELNFGFERVVFPQFSRRLSIAANLYHFTLSSTKLQSRESFYIHIHRHALVLDR